MDISSWQRPHSRQFFQRALAAANARRERFGTALAAKAVLSV
jgi:hypothetical protein